MNARSSTLLLTCTRSEMCYCPGCSHGIVLEHLGRALSKIGVRAQEVCIVSDIGCIGTADRYFSCNTFHGLHGRAVTYAEGIKRAHPQMLVIVLMGDGGCGIGTAHLVHAARRNTDIKVIVCNNFNFGMTGGQHSPTTPTAGVTATTPDGFAEHPLDVCRTVIASGASFVCRYSALDKDCTEHLVRVLTRPGFVLADLWELCVAYYVPRNRLTAAKLTDLSETLNMPFGVLHEAPVRPAATAKRPLVTPAACIPKTVDQSIDWPHRTEIRVAGSAGQHIRSAVSVIGELAVACGAFAVSQDDFPITVRKGFSISDLILDNQPIHYTGVDRPELLIVLSPDGLLRLGALNDLMPHTLIVTAENLDLGDTGGIVHRINLRHLQGKTGKGLEALAALAYGIVTQDWMTGEALLAAARHCLSGQYRDARQKAIECGIRLLLNKGDTTCTVQ